jgi:hypothetical protein
MSEGIVGLGIEYVLLTSLKSRLENADGCHDVASFDRQFLRLPLPLASLCTCTITGKWIFGYRRGTRHGSVALSRKSQDCREQ